MAQNSPTDPITKLKTVTLSSYTPPTREELKEYYISHPDSYRKRKAALSPSKNYWENAPLGRTLTGRNKAGRTIRRIGLGALSVAGGILGIDTTFLQPDAGPSEVLQILQTIETIAWIIAGVILAITKGSDQIEIRGERLDEMEILEGKIPLTRKLK